MATSARQRLDELLLARATEGVTACERAELDALLAQYPDVDANAYERAAAAVCLAALGRGGALPERLRRRLESSAAQLATSAGER